MIINCIEPLGISRDRLEALQADFAAMGHSFNFFLDRNEDPSVLVERMKDADVVVVSNIPLPASVLCHCPNLKFLSVGFTGLDHIDLDYCREHHIVVQNAAGYSTTAVSELAIGLMIDVLRKVSDLDRALRRGASRGGFLGRQLRGKTVGVVGTGAIGTAVIRLLLAFGCQVLAYSRTCRDDVASLGVSYVSLHDLLRCSDIVTLHVPLNDSTRALIGANELKMMKPSAVLINTARGPVCDMDAVAQALADGTIAGAGFDVYECEPPLPSTHPLLLAPNCVCVPHVGYATREAFDIRAGIVFNHVRFFLDC